MFNNYNEMLTKKDEIFRVLWNEVELHFISIFFSFHSVSSDFSEESQIWKTEQACHKIYQDGLEKTPSVGMWNLFIGFLHERLLLGGSRDTSDQVSITEWKCFSFWWRCMLISQRFSLDSYTAKRSRNADQNLNR